MPRLIDADELIELIDDDIALLETGMSREGYDISLCTLKMVKQYIKALPTVPLDWKSIMDDWTEHDNAMIAKGREIERRLNAPKHGRWLIYNILDYAKRPTGRKVGKCSVCGQLTPDFRLITEEPNWNYCPNCGAKMDEVEE